MRFIWFVLFAFLFIFVDGWLWVPLGITLLYVISARSRRVFSGKWWKSADTPTPHAEIWLFGTILGTSLFGVDEMFKLFFGLFL